MNLLVCGQPHIANSNKVYSKGEVRYNKGLDSDKGREMPRPYSEDLRDRVLKVVDEKKMTMDAISKMFKIDRKTIY